MIESADATGRKGQQEAGQTRVVIRCSAATSKKRKLADENHALSHQGPGGQYFFLIENIAVFFFLFAVEKKILVKTPILRGPVKSNMFPIS